MRSRPASAERPVKTSLGRATRYAAEAAPGAESRETDRRTGDGEVSLDETGDVRVRPWKLGLGESCLLLGTGVP